MRPFPAVATACLALALGSTIQAKSPAITLEQYRGLIHTAQARLQASARAGNDLSAAANALEPLTRPYFVQMESWGVESAPLFDQTDVRLLKPKSGSVDSETLKNVAERLQTAADALDEPAAPSEQRADQALRKELERSEYRSPEFLEFLRQAVEGMMRWLSGLLGRGGAGTGAAIQALSWVVTAAVAVLLMALAWIAIFRNGLLRRRASAKPGEHLSDEPEIPEDALDRARDLQKRGEFLQALRLLYRATLLRLHEAGAVRMEPGMTNREVLRRLQRPDLKQAMREATDLFDDRFYHIETATSDDCASMFGHYQQVLRVL
ncbi:MAG: DUF4129 domain-containing protein [Armatimonadetes bacterium]|nr:DUF4129 domain-containing protein [Armatimonadota bacterium]